MRWQWRDMVRTLDWEAMEAVARGEPGQQICDTVHELSRGLDNNADVRRARRILYFLKQAGFEPTPHESHDSGYDEPTLSRYGFIGTVDHLSYGEVGVVAVEDGKLRWIIADHHISAGFAYVRTGTRARQGAGDLRYQLLHRGEKSRYIVQAPPDYCLRHLSYLMQSSRVTERGDALDYWRPLIDDLPFPGHHPTRETGGVMVPDEECRTAWKSDPMSAKWKFWLHRGRHPELVEALRRLGPDAGYDERLSAIREHRHEWIEPRFIMDAMMRHYDHSWALRERGEVEKAKAFARVATAVFCEQEKSPFFEAWEEAAAEGILEENAEAVVDSKHQLFTASVA